MHILWSLGLVTLIGLINGDTLTGSMFIKLKDMRSEHDEAIENLTRVIQNLTSLVGNQRKTIENLTDIIEQTSLGSIVAQQESLLKVTNETIEELKTDVAQEAVKTNSLQSNLSSLLERFTIVETEVAFEVVVGEVNNVNDNEFLTFTTIALNVGNGINSTTIDRFVVPYTGVYYFTYSAGLADAKGTGVYGQLVTLTGAFPTSCFTGNDQYDSLTCSTVKSLGAGEQVSLRIISTVADRTIWMASFAGHLIKRLG